MFKWWAAPLMRFGAHGAIIKFISQAIKATCFAEIFVRTARAARSDNDGEPRRPQCQADRPLATNSCPS